MGGTDGRVSKPIKQPSSRSRGFFRLIGDPRFGHSIQTLLSDLPMECRKLGTSHHRKCARLLDRFYIPTRNADAFSEGAPREHYDKDDALEARECAELLIWNGGGLR